MRSKILGLFDNSLTANYEYFRSKRENLPLPIEIKVSEKPEMFCGTFLQFLRSKLSLPCSETKKNLHSSSISKVIESERFAYLNS